MMNAPIDAPKPNFVTVAGNYNGKKLNSPNDLFVTAAGDIYFTDPSYGFERKDGNVFAAGPGGIWIFSKAGKLLGRIKLNNLSATNCALTPDGKTVFITAETYLLRVKMR